MQKQKYNNEKNADYNKFMFLDSALTYPFHLFSVL